MPAHRRARLQHAAPADRLHDRPVLALKRLAVGTFRHSRPAADRLARDDETSEMFQKAPELRVSCRVGDAAVERKILGDRVLAVLEGGVNSIQALGDFPNLE